MTPDEYEAAMARLEFLIDEDPGDATPEMRELDILGTLLAVHEARTIDIVNLPHLIVHHFMSMGKVWPNTPDALHFVTTEVGEAMELDLARRPYIRNNPQNKRPFTPENYAEELGDIIYMALVAGHLEDVDPIKAMLAKMERQLRSRLDGETAAVPTEPA